MARDIDFIGIGAARSGTSWIADVLRKHPQICLSEPKEVRYFNHFQLPIGRTKGRANENFEKSIDWYLAHFEHASSNQIRGEFSPIYMCDLSAPAAIHDRFPEVKIIACLRNPVDRAYSHYWYHRGHRFHSISTFKEAIHQEEGYADLGLYARQLERYLEYFDSRKMLILIYEELVRDPKAGIRELLTFLEVDANTEIQWSRQRLNPSAQLRSTMAKTVADELSRKLIGTGHGRIFAGLRQLGAHRLWNSVLVKPMDKPAIAPNVRVTLWRHFQDDVKELEKLLGRKLEIWRPFQ